MAFHSVSSSKPVGASIFVIVTVSPLVKPKSAGGPFGGFEVLRLLKARSTLSGKKALFNIVRLALTVPSLFSSVTLSPTSKRSLPTVTPFRSTSFIINHIASYPTPGTNVPGRANLADEGSFNSKPLPYSSGLYTHVNEYSAGGLPTGGMLYHHCVAQ